MKMKPLRILYVVTTFPSVTETFIATQISSMKALGHECTLFSYQKSPEQIRHKIIADFQLDKDVVFHFKNEKSFFKRFLGFLSFFTTYFFEIRFLKLISLLHPFRVHRNLLKFHAFWDMPVFLLDREYDIIHCHFGFNAVKLTRAFRAGIVPKSKFIVTFHGSDLTPSKIEDYKEIYKDMFSCFDVFTVNTPFLEQILKRVKPNIQPVFILPVGFNPDYLIPFLDLEKDRTQFKLLYCGRLMSLKGPDIALQILHLLHQRGYSNMRLIVIGEGELACDLKILSRELGVSEYVDWKGAVSQEEVFYQMATADVFLYTGREEEGTGRVETQGLVIQEAQFLKLPVIVSNVGGVKYGVLNGVSGYLVNSGDLNQFCEHIASFYHDAQKREQFGLAGHHFVLNKYASKTLVDDLMCVYLYPTFTS